MQLAYPHVLMGYVKTWLFLLSHLSVHVEVIGAAMIFIILSLSLLLSKSLYIFLFPQFCKKKVKHYNLYNFKLHCQKNLYYKDYSHHLIIDQLYQNIITTYIKSPFYYTYVKAILCFIVLIVRIFKLLIRTLDNN